MSELTLHGYWRSSAAYRVRIALNLKGVDYAQVTHDLRIGAQQSDAYRKLAPHALVPTLQSGNFTLIESPAILEWIEATWPQPCLLPGSPEDVAIIRSMAALIGCEIHPLNNLRVLNKLKSTFNATEDQLQQWIQGWMTQGFEALEIMIARHGGGYAFGRTPTLADCYLVPQLYSARRFHVDLTAYPHVVAASEAAERLEAVQAAHPDRQPDADR